MELVEKECIMDYQKGEIDGKVITVTDVEGINFPFRIYIPNNISENADVILANSTPSTMKELTCDEAVDVLLGKKHYDRNTKTLIDCHENKIIQGCNPLTRYLSSDLGNICIMPCFPRPLGLDTSYLGYKVYHNEFDTALKKIERGSSKYTKEEIERFKDIHLQYYKMIKFTLEYLDSLNISHEDKVIVTGYSAASKFSNFFTMLHPDVVKAVIAGGTGGNSIIPVELEDVEKEENEKTKECLKAFLDIEYPVGVKDIPKENVKAFKEIPQYYYIGGADFNDLTKFKPKWETKEDGTPLMDCDGNTIPKRNDGEKSYIEKEVNGEIKLIPIYVPYDKIEYDLDKDGNKQIAYDEGYYTVEQIESIINLLGDNTQTRFNKIKELYNELGVDSTFEIYEGYNHSNIFNCDKVISDVVDFINKLNVKKMKK